MSLMSFLAFVAFASYAFGSQLLRNHDIFNYYVKIVNIIKYLSEGGLLFVFYEGGLSMNKNIRSAKSLLAALILPLVFAASALATEHVYQVTGPVLATTGTSITVQKGKAPWTVIRDANTRMSGDVKVGDKVAIKYHMVADTIATKTLPVKH